MRKALLAALLAVACAHDEGRPVPTAPEPGRGGSGLHAMSFGAPQAPYPSSCSCPTGYTEYHGGLGYGCWKCYDNHNDPPQPSNSCGVAVGPPMIPCGSGGGGGDPVESSPPPPPSVGFADNSLSLLTTRAPKENLEVTIEVREWIADADGTDWTCVPITDTGLIGSHLGMFQWNLWRDFEEPVATETVRIREGATEGRAILAAERRRYGLYSGEGPDLAGFRRYEITELSHEDYRIDTSNRLRYVIMSGQNCAP